MKRSIPFILLAIIPLSLQAQDTNEYYRAIYDKAEQDYNIGRLEQAEQQLTENLKNFPIELRQSAYRMLALCYLGLDQEDDAQEYAKMLMRENPYYSTTINDPQRFIDMIDKIKSGLIATITTASSQEESLDEVPVPTTLITEEMIRNSGATNLQEVLAAYVPGMTIVDCNDDINIAMRGVYSNGQEKILIMLNGHRLNSYCTNIAAPDFSIGLEKLKRIEVLRGPASSLYGGVALTAVVNLITKQGADIDGVKMKAGIGNYGQMRGDILIGKRYFDLDMLVWGSLYKSDGQEYYIDASKTGLYVNGGNITVGGIGNKPSYDAGASIKYKDLKFLYNTHFSHVHSPYTMTYTISPYTAEKYRSFNGIKPSFATNSHHVELSYGRTLGNVFLNGNVSYDNSDLTHYQVITEPKIEPTLIEILPVPSNIKRMIEGTGGIARYINGQENTIGGKLQGGWNYINNKNHKGQLSFGGEYSYFELSDVRYAFIYNYNKLIPESDTISQLGKGHESNLNGYIQLKHHWRSFILNAGLRIDHKQQYNESKYTEFSPRIAFIYLQPKWNMKLSYSKSFVDAPYLYRKSNQFLYHMQYNEKLTENLTPEILHSFQMTFGARQWLKGLNFELNAFYNQARDLIYLDLIDHYNGGKIDNYGLELTGNYENKRFSANLNFTWQKVAKNSDYMGLETNKTYNIPELSANAVFAWKPIKNLKLHGHVSFYGQQTAQYINLEQYGVSRILSLSLIEYISKHAHEIEKPEVQEQIMKQSAIIRNVLVERYKEEDVDSRVIFNLGANYTYKNLELGFNVRNIFNTKYFQSGMSTGLIPQKGRWFMFDIAYKF